MLALRLTLLCGCCCIYGPNSRDEGARTALHGLAKMGYNYTASFILSLGIADCNVADSEGDTALHYAVVENRLDSVKLLLDHGADPYMQNNVRISYYFYVLKFWYLY
jgi:ankyrin repeat protein